MLKMPKKEIVSELTSNEFYELIKNSKDKLVIVDFFAEWCMPCVMMAPVMSRLAEEHSNIKIAKVNVDDSQDLAQEYEVSSIPCIIFFKEGEEVDRIIGSVNENILEEKISDYS